MSTLLYDLRYGLRMLLKNPGFTFAALITLALGIASSTAIFSVVDGVLLHPLPYPDSENIVALSQTVRSTGIATSASSPANYIDWLAQNDVFSVMAAARGAQTDLTDGDPPERIKTTTTTSSLFPLFGVAPILGRTLLPSDEQPGHDHVVVLSSELWERRYGSDRSIVGREISLNGQPHTVVGVMPPNFSPDGYGELWLPSPWGVPANSLRVNVDPRPIRDSNYLDVWARLKPGVTLEKARTEMDAIARRLEAQYQNANMDVGIRVTPLHEEAVGSIRPVLFLLFAAVGFLLFIGCANVANLLLARAATRARGFQSDVFFFVRFVSLPAKSEPVTADLLRRTVQSVDPILPVLELRSFAKHLDGSPHLWIVRAGAALFSIFGGLALGLAAIGVYGVRAYSVARRTREIGIRMALGAQGKTVQWMILREGFAMVAAGLALGLLLAFGTGKIVSSILFQVSSLDPFAFTLAPAILATAVLLATWLPARRSTRISPMVALRAE